MEGGSRGNGKSRIRESKDNYFEECFYKGEQKNGIMAGWGLGYGVKERYYCFVLFMMGDNRTSLSDGIITVA